MHAGLVHKLRRTQQRVNDFIMGRAFASVTSQLGKMVMRFKCRLKVSAQLVKLPPPGAKQFYEADEPVRMDYPKWNIFHTNRYVTIIIRFTFKMHKHVVPSQIVSQEEAFTLQFATLRVLSKYLLRFSTSLHIPHKSCEFPCSP